MRDDTIDNARSAKVHFAEHDDIFIIREEDDDKLDVLGLSASSADLDAESAACFLGEEDSADCVDIRESMRECVYKWSNTPYWKLLEGSVDDEAGEAKDVQKYITSFARVEVQGDVPRGLERQLCRSHHEARRNLADNATHAVLSNDFRLRYENTAKTSDEEIWKELRHTYKKHSHGAKAFARKMGKADEAAVLRDTLSETQALELIEELQERAKAGAIRAKPSRSSSMSEVQKRSHKERVAKTDSGSSKRSKSQDPIPGDSDHTLSSKKGKRRTPFRVPSMPTMSSRDKDKGASDKHAQGNDGDHAADLFHEVDKKGKTKRSSRWRSLKKKISKSVHKERSPRAQ